MKKESLSEWLWYLEHQHPSLIRLGLERIQTVMAYLGISKFPCPVIKVGGTNGKGSVVSFLESFYRAQGYQVGVYTSPHLLHYHERIQINRQPIQDRDLTQIFSEIEQVKGNISLTYFEYGTLAAFLYFLRHPLDIIILEIGMGGRLDAVNTIEADLSVITNIELDHCEWLGETREAIAYEKAGIIDKNAMFVCGDPTPPQILKSTALKQHSTFYFFSKDYHYEKHQKHWNFLTNDSKYEYRLPHPKLSHHNAAIALMSATALLEKIPVTLQALTQGIKDAYLPGRQEKIEFEGRDLWLDVAHNPNGIESLVKRIIHYYSLQNLPLTQNIRIVFGMLQDKDQQSCLHLLSEISHTWFLAELPTQRSEKTAHLQTLLLRIQKEAQVKCFQNGMEAYHDAFFSSQKGDIILVCGSFFIVSEIIAYIKGSTL